MVQIHYSPFRIAILHIPVSNGWSRFILVKHYRDSWTPCSVLLTVCWWDVLLWVVSSIGRTLQWILVRRNFGSSPRLPFVSSVSSSWESIGVLPTIRKVGRVVYCAGLLNLCGSNVTAGSNPALSDCVGIVHLIPRTYGGNGRHASLRN